MFNCNTNNVLDARSTSTRRIPAAPTRVKFFTLSHDHKDNITPAVTIASGVERE